MRDGFEISGMGSQKTGVKEVAEIAEPVSRPDGMHSTKAGCFPRMTHLPVIP